MGTKFSSKRDLTKEEEAEIRRMIASDPDNPELTDEQIAEAKPFADMFPTLAENMKRGRGRPKVDNPKQHVSLRLDPDVLEKFKATGPGWQARINDALRDAKV